MSVKITQVRSIAKKNLKQKRTIIALGLGKINKTVEHQLTPSIEGMIKKVEHLITVEK